MGARARGGSAALAALVLACAAREDLALQPQPPASEFEPIPNVELTTQRGEHVRFYDDLVRDRTVVIQFFFTHCEGICPVSTGTMLSLQEELGERLGRDVDFLSITLDPARDTPEVLAEHARAIGARPGWTFLT